ncbi:MAG: glutathione S-transferase family protein [Rhizomicrobium sp.]
MSYTIFGDKGSGAFSAEAVLAEAGAPYEFRLVSLDRHEQKQPEFLAINPSGKIPALRLPEGEVITESSAILLTVADHFPNARLLPPQGGYARAQAFRWLAYMASEIYPMVEIVDYPERFAPEGDEAKALRLKARDRVRQRMLLIERSIAGAVPARRRLLDLRHLRGDVQPLVGRRGMAPGESQEGHRTRRRGRRTARDRARLGPPFWKLSPAAYSLLK